MTSSFSVPTVLRICRQTNWNVLFSCKHHALFCPKYRRPVLMPPIDVRLKGLIQHVCDETQSGLIEMEVMPDHVHLLLDCDPRFGIHRLVRGIKVGHRVCFGRNFRCCGHACQHFGRTAISSATCGAPLAHLDGDPPTQGSAGSTSALVAGANREVCRCAVGTIHQPPGNPSPLRPR